MPAAIDISNQKFGRLTALFPTEKGQIRRWVFRCDCGVEKSMNPATVKSGKAQSCGCLRREITAQKRFKDLTGKRFGRLTVLGQLPDRTIHKHVQWQCQCDCGKRTVTTTLGKRDGTRSCGCIRRELISKLGKSSKQKNPISRTPEYRATMRKKRRERPEQAMAERVSRLLCWALASVNAIKRSATFQLLGYTPADLVKHIEKNFIDGMSWDNRKQWHIDHIKPISSAKTEADVIRLNQLSNLRPLWARDNMSKGAR